MKYPEIQIFLLVLVQNKYFKYKYYKQVEKYLDKHPIYLPISNLFAEKLTLSSWIPFINEEQ